MGDALLMTDVEKTLEMLNSMAEVAKADRLNQLRESAVMQKELYDSYVDAGFSISEALELTKAFVVATLLRVPR